MSERKISIHVLINILKIFQVTWNWTTKVSWYSILRFILNQHSALIHVSKPIVLSLLLFRLFLRDCMLRLLSMVSYCLLYFGLQKKKHSKKETDAVSPRRRIMQKWLMPTRYLLRTVLFISEYNNDLIRIFCSCLRKWADHKRWRFYLQPWLSTALFQTDKLQLDDSGNENKQ